MKKITLLVLMLFTALSYAQVGINIAIPHTSSALDITSTTAGFLPPRMTAVQRAEIVNPALGLMVFCTNCASGDGELQVYYVSGWKNAAGGDITDPPAIGDTHQGGIVFYLDGSGGGLIAAPTDQSTWAEWGCYGTTTGADGEAIGTGASNTTAILSGCASAGTAAEICANLTLGEYSDWFLPSKDELNLMRENIGQGNIGSFGNDYYWSSTEIDHQLAWEQRFGDGGQLDFYKDDQVSVRAVRAF